MEDHKALIDRLGGNTAVAKLCGTTQSAVSQWRKAGIPELRMYQIRALRPDAFEQEKADVQVR